MSKGIIRAICICCLLFSKVAFAEIIQKIVIKNNHRIEKSTIRNYLNLNVGTNLTLLKQDQATKDLYATSLFENVNLEFSKGTLTVTVQEVPLISKVEFKGNAKISKSTIEKEILTRAGESLNSSKINLDKNKIKDIYKRYGRFLVKVDCKIENVGVNKAIVKFDILEGPKTKVNNIYFIGNKAFMPSILKSVIATKERAWYRFLDNGDTYDPDKIEYDKSVLKNFYNAEGYADFQTIEVLPRITKTKDSFNITYVIHEGSIYSLGNISFDIKIKNVEESELRQFIKVQKGDKYNLTKLEEIADKINEYLQNKGYPEITVYPDLEKNFDDKIVDITFVIEKADKIFINKINISGNVKTEDHVIRRQFKAFEGDLLTKEVMQKTERNIRNLDYFEKVDLQVKPTAKRDKYDIDLDVEEKSTANIGLETGYDTSQGLFGRIALNEKNFLGKGKFLHASVGRTKSTTSYSFGITEPHFLDRDLTLGIHVFTTFSGSHKASWGAGDKQPYNLNTYGGRLSLGYDITEDLSHDVFYEYKHEKLSISQNSESIFVQEQRGKFQTSAIGQELTYDRTDNRVFPKYGYIISGTQKYAGVGGNKKYLKHELDFKAFKSFFNNNLTFKLSTSAGLINGMQGQKVKINDRFQLGDYSFRGFAPQGVGPRDKNTQTALGGQKFYTITLEALFPLGLPENYNVKGSVFTDIGALWDVDLLPHKLYTKDTIRQSKKPNMSIGFGILWMTRVAPIKMDFAIPIKRKSYDETQKFHLKFSTFF